MKLQHAGNTHISDGLKGAMAALVLLDDSGCTVFGVALGERRPVIQIDGPRGDFLKGALKSRITINGVQRCTMAMQVHGCQVEWQEAFAVAARAQRS